MLKTKNQNYKERFEKNIKNTEFAKLDESLKVFITNVSFRFLLSFSEINLLVTKTLDLRLFGEANLRDLRLNLNNKNDFFKSLDENIEKILLYKNYKNFSSGYEKINKIIEHKPKPSLALGSCPVASSATRCCNLLTLDAVQSCNFDCSYCSIGHFYEKDKVVFDTNFKKNLLDLKLDRNKTYHIGTGQSSDSLSFGNKGGVLEALFSFAQDNPNVILELKSKSSNISYLLKHKIPKNIITTWSLNPPTIIKHEEHKTASLKSRLNAAQKIAATNLVGFHFHPMFAYDGYKADYQKIADEILARFSPQKLAMISMGVPTFTKPVIKFLRLKPYKSKVLQMPMQGINKKLSYPLDLKLEIFSNLYNAFKPWHEKVFFYLCMEEKLLWKKIFNYEYDSNEAFENAMINAYKAKILSL